MKLHSIIKQLFTYDLKAKLWSLCSSYVSWKTLIYLGGKDVGIVMSLYIWVFLVDAVVLRKYWICISLYGKPFTAILVVRIIIWTSRKYKYIYSTNLYPREINMRITKQTICVYELHFRVCRSWGLPCSTYIRTKISV